jgi:hypothetical protein
MSVCVRCCPVLLLFRVWVSLEVGWPVWCFGGFQAVTVGPVRLTGLTSVEPLSESCPVSPAGTGLTGGAHRSDRCWSMDSRFAVPLRSQVGRVCVLVHRSSGTSVATWAWPTWVVSRRRVLEALFTMLEFPSPSRRIFIDSHSLPPLSGSLYRSFKWYQSRFGSLLTLTSLRSKDGVPGTGFRSSTLRWQELPYVE